MGTSRSSDIEGVEGWCTGRARCSPFCDGLCLCGNSRRMGDQTDGAGEPRGSRGSPGCAYRVLGHGSQVLEVDYFGHPLWRRGSHSHSPHQRDRSDRSCARRSTCQLRGCTVTSCDSSKREDVEIHGRIPSPRESIGARYRPVGLPLLLCLTAHYRTQMSFSWESLEANAAALNRLYKTAFEDGENLARTSSRLSSKQCFMKSMKILTSLAALARIWDMVRSDADPA